MLLKKSAIVFLACVVSLKAFTQHYNFISYNIEEGLAQSQVIALAQSTDGQLWMSTLGGISRFDGKNFYNYTASGGLAASFPIHFVVDYSARTWAITNSHLNLIQGDKIYTYNLPETVINSRARLAVTNDNILWCLINGNLYSFNKNKFTKTSIEGFPNNGFFSLLRGEQKNIFLMAPQRTLYKYEAGTWKRFMAVLSLPAHQRINNIYFDSTGITWLVSHNKLYIKRPADTAVSVWFSTEEERETLNCITRDRNGNVWVAGSNGAYRIRPDKTVQHFNYTNGFSSYFINDIITDEEGNIWFGANGDGLLKFGGSTFTLTEPAAKESYPGVHVLSYDNKRQTLIYGNSGYDLCFASGSQTSFPFRNSVLRDVYIDRVYVDTGNVLWIGTSGAGLWKYENGKLKPTPFNRNSIYGIARMGNKLFFTADNGLIVEENGVFTRVSSIDEYTNSPIVIGNDSLIVAAQFGIILIKDTSKATFNYPDILRRSSIAAFEKKGDNLFVATLGGGIFIWSLKTNDITQLKASTGLASDMIYSLKFDNNNNLWAGSTSCVIRLSSTDNFNTVTIRNYGKDEGLKGMESNQDAIAVSPQNEVWFGTTKGLYGYHPQEEALPAVNPRLTIQGIKLFSRPLLPEKDSNAVLASSYSLLPQHLTLNSDQNHITFEFRAISYSYSNIRYSYYLHGLERDFSVPALSDFVVYPSLPPGDYVFKVKATDASGKQLGEIITYPFSITPAIHQTLWFRIGLGILVIAMALAVYFIRKNSKAKQQKMIENLRSQELSKIRKKTAQDFHDEMGNKLARITVLSDMLNSKLPANEETQGLAKKIQENAALLYQGTKDIIWSLSPENDNLYFLLKYINDFAVDLYLDTDIEFEPFPIEEEYKNYSLTMDCARNIIMICKETYTNILKHSQCSKVKTQVSFTGKHTLRIAITDNGKGFDTEQSNNGNGLTNIRQRAAYLDAGLEINSGNGHGGTTVLLSVNLTPQAGEKK